MVFLAVEVSCVSLERTLANPLQTKGRSLAELDELFNDRISVWRFSKHVTLVQQRAGEGEHVAESQDRV
jgi:hypothetical protein